MSDSIEVLAKKVEEARDRLCSAHEDTEAARREETARLNTYNEACREFDKAVATLREGAPWNTDWHQSLRKRGPS